MISMGTTTSAVDLPRVTRKAIANGKRYRYMNATTGELITKSSLRVYGFASAYREVETIVGHEPVTVRRTQPNYTAAQIAEWGETYESSRPVYGRVPEEEQAVRVWLHARADLAAKGSPDANRIRGLVRIPGVITIEEVE